MGVITEEPLLFVCGMSRSGTTLLATVLDSHSKISLGYELIPASLPNPLNVMALLDDEIGAAGGDLKSIGRKIRNDGHEDAGQFIKRCDRAGLICSDVEDVLRSLVRDGFSSISSLRDRLAVACKMAEKKKVNEKTDFFGFKLNINAYEKAYEYFPNSYMVYILRDPRDVVASHFKNNFKRTLEYICIAWNKYIKNFRTFHDKHPERSCIIRYEDLVSRPQQTIKKIFDCLPLDVEESVFRFYESKASVHVGGHPNADALSSSFFTTSIGRWKSELTDKDSRAIERYCSKQMALYRYSFPLVQINDNVIERHANKYATKKKYSIDDYEKILGQYLDEYEVLRYCDYIKEEAIGDRKILIIRHDVDHDYMTALKMARWEREHGLRATYSLLHDAWYYGRLTGGCIEHTANLVDFARELHELGHEVSLHNNLAITALKEQVDIEELLVYELDFFRSIGVPVVGSSTHGDAICREYNFRNYEIFKECCDGRYGGPRTILYKDKNISSVVSLAQLSMFDYGLEYESYDLFWDLYHTDSGGELQLRKRRNGRRHFARKDRARGSLVGMLCHPIYWRF